MPLHIDFRPDTLDNIVGNRTTVDSLRNVLSKESRPHSYLFTGPRGCGKTTLARIAANMCGCIDFDLVELDTAQFGNIDSVRAIRRKMYKKSLHGGNRGWLLDEVHMLGEGGASEKNKPQNALLKALEEPPPHVYFFLCTTDPDRLLGTIRDRCNLSEVSPLTQKQTISLLSSVTEETIPDEVLLQIAKDSNGHPREALISLEKVIGMPERQMLRAIKQSVSAESKAIDLCRALIQKKSWKVVTEILKGLGKEEPEKIRRDVIGYASAVLLSKADPHAYVVLDCFREPFYNTGRPGLVLACYEALEAE